MYDLGTRAGVALGARVHLSQDLPHGRYHHGDPLNVYNASCPHVYLGSLPIDPYSINARTLPYARKPLLKAPALPHSHLTYFRARFSPPFARSSDVSLDKFIVFTIYGAAHSSYGSPFLQLNFVSTHARITSIHVLASPLHYSLLQSKGVDSLSYVRYYRIYNSAPISTAEAGYAVTYDTAPSHRRPIQLEWISDWRGDPFYDIAK